MKISACVITKNEEKNIGKWLQEMSAIADEMIVVDTGSTDNTVNMAKRAGAKVYHFKWINDFAAAKNHAIEQATGDWILFLDADEYFSDETKHNVRNLLKEHHKNKKVGSIRCRLINIDIDNKNKIVDAMVQVRIFRNIPQIRYRGKVHENIFNSGAKTGMIFSDKIEILHTGYSSSILKSKTERNMKILEAKRAEEGDSYDVIAGCMDAYMVLEQYEEAYRYAKLSIEKGMVFYGLEGHNYEILVHSLTQLVSQGKEPIEKLYDAMDEAMKEFPNEPSFPIEKGYVLWQVRDYIGAMKYLQQGMKIRKEFEEQCANGIGLNDNSKKMLPMAYEAMGNIYILRRRYKEAAECFIKGINQYKYYAPNIRGLCHCIKDASLSEIVESICRFYDKEKDADFLASELRGHVDYQIYNYFAKRSENKHNDEVEALLSNQHYDSSAILLSNNLKREYNISGVCIDRSNREHTEWLNTLLPDMYKNTKQSSVKRIEKEAGTLLRDSEKNPLVSIMIPTYNRPVMFEKTLKSALAQTYPNVEILVNDNSTNDDTENLIQKYLGDKRLRYFRNYKAKSKEENFIHFEKQARGSLLQWCMDDDILAPEKLKKMVPILRDNPKVTLVTSQRNFIDAEDNVIYDPVLQHKLDLKGECNGLTGYWAGYNTLTESANFIGEPSATLFRRKDLKHHYWRAESKGLYTISDVAMWLELMEKGDLVIFRDPLSSYRRHKEQEGQLPEVILLSRMEWLQLIEEYYSRGIFLTDEDAYKKSLLKLYNEYVKFFVNPNNLDLKSYTSAPNYEKYKQAMEGIAEKLK